MTQDEPAVGHARGSTAVHRSRVRILGAAAVFVIIVMVVVSYWPSGPSRTDRVVEVYADQLGLTDEEAEIVRGEALETAAYICSIKAEDLQSEVSHSTMRAEDAIALVRAACPERADEFEAVLPTTLLDLPTERPDLIVEFDSSLSRESKNRLGMRLASVRGVRAVRRDEGDEDMYQVTLRDGADEATVIEGLEAVSGVTAVRQP